MANIMPPQQNIPVGIFTRFRTVISEHFKTFARWLLLPVTSCISRSNRALYFWLCRSQLTLPFSIFFILAAISVALLSSRVILYSVVLHKLCLRPQILNITCTFQHVYGLLLESANLLF